MVMKKYLVEFIGTFFLVLTVGMTVIDPGAGQPRAAGHRLGVDDHGLCGRPCFRRPLQSGGHAGRVAARALPAAGRAAAICFRRCWAAAWRPCSTLRLKGDPTVTPAEIKIVPALVAELVGTFALAYVVLNVATAKGTAGNSNYGLAIGFTVMTMAFALGGISGGAFNPAVAVGITIMHLEKVANIWIYLVGNFAGGALAAAGVQVRQSGGQMKDNSKESEKRRS